VLAFQLRAVSAPDAGGVSRLGRRQEKIKKHARLPFDPEFSRGEGMGEALPLPIAVLGTKGVKKIEERTKPRTSENLETASGKIPPKDSITTPQRKTGTKKKKMAKPSHSQRSTSSPGQHKEEAKNR